MGKSVKLSFSSIPSKKVGLALLTLFFMVVAVLPVLQVVWQALWHNGSFPKDASFFLFARRTWPLLGKSVFIASSVAVLATILGIGISFILVKTPVPYKTILQVLLILPLFLPPFITTVAWVDVFLFVGLSPVVIYSTDTVIFVLTVLFTPIAILIFSLSLSNLNANQEAAALLLVPYAKVFLRIILPLIKPAILSSLLLIFVLAVSEFTVPAFLSVPVLVTDIFTQFAAFYNYSTAITQSSLLILLCLLGLLIEHKLTAGKIFLTVSGRNQPSQRMLTDKTKWFVFGILVAYLVGSTFIPLALLIQQSFARGINDILKAFHLLQAEMKQSFLFAMGGAGIITLTGFGFSYLKNKGPYVGIDFMLLGTFCIPSVVAGIALISYYNTPFFNLIYASPGIILIAYLMRYTFIAERLLMNRLLQLPESLEQAARIHGAGTGTYLRRILLPLSAQALFGAFIISFIFCLSELGTVIMVYPPGTSLLPIKIFTLMANAPQSLISSLCLVTLLFTGSVLGLLFSGWYFIRKGIGGAYG
jgi:iron(III) transport system permease protein